jgi:hypothetical protein
MTGGLDQLARSVLRVEISWLSRKRADQRQAPFGIRLNPESGGSVFAAFRRFAVSPFLPSFLLVSGKTWETRGQQFPDLALDLVGLTRAID